MSDYWNVATAADHVLGEVVVGMLRGFPQASLGFDDHGLLLDGLGTHMVLINLYFSLVNVDLE